MAISIEAQIKRQFAKIFTADDWRVFKLLAGYYIKTATRLRKRDVDIVDTFKLLARNAQKRLFIGVGCELLVKASFLKQGYGINKIDFQEMKRRSLGQPALPYRIGAVAPDLLIETDTFSFNQILDQLRKMPVFAVASRQERQIMMRGFKIAKVFRNKEGHVATLWHDFDPTNYSDVEHALVLFYRVAFAEQLKIQFSVERNEQDLFEITPLR